MILGASIYQVPLIRTARRMGLYTIVVSIPGDYPGFALADKIYELNTRDKEAILADAQAKADQIIAQAQIQTNELWPSAQSAMSVKRCICPAFRMRRRKF